MSRYPKETQNTRAAEIFTYMQADLALFCLKVQYNRKKDIKGLLKNFASLPPVSYVDRGD
jgi:hypothetical protein